MQAWYKKYFTPQKMMRTVLLSTLLPFLFGIYLYGWRVLALLLVVTAAGVATEFLFQRHYKKKISEAVFVSCILYTLTLPPSMPFWMAVIGIVFGLFFGKLVFGGFGANPFNPALVARAFVYVNFPEPMTISWTQNAHGLPGGFARFLLPEIDAVTEATPMILFNNTGSTQPLGDMIFGNIPGAIGETSVLIILIAAAYLIWKKVASWEVMAGGVVSFIVLQSFMYYVVGAPVVDPMYGLVMGGFCLPWSLWPPTPFPAAKRRKASLSSELLSAL